ncbi:MAG: DUF3540 domain-containing protein [Gammaproteobacteria bacterium]|nr:DUF3540 domain-containing protein [Gammaproteobacteria bacterium]
MGAPPGGARAARAGGAAGAGGARAAPPPPPAASCLLRPRVGDRVLCWSGAWVLAVLERSDPRAPAVLAAPDRLSNEAPRV